MITYLGHYDRGSHTPPLPSISQLGGITSGGKELAIAEAQQVELVDIRVLCLPRERSLVEERLRKLQGCFYNGVLCGENKQCLIYVCNI